MSTEDSENDDGLRKLTPHTLIEEIKTRILSLFNAEHCEENYYKGGFDREDIGYEINGILDDYEFHIRDYRENKEIEEIEKNSVRDAISFLKDKGYQIRKRN